MNFPPTLKQLRYLVALAKTLHFGKAADDCHVTQSTLSAGIQELESLLGAQLVERSKRSVMLTSLGAAIVTRAQRILNDVDDLVGLAIAENNPKGGTVRLGIIPTIAPFLLPKIMPAIERDMPDLILHLREDKSGDLCDQLRIGDLDVVLYALPYPCGEAVELPLFEDSFVAAYPKKQAPNGKIDPSDLKKEKLLLLEEGHCLREHALEACRLSDLSSPDTLAGTSLHTVIQMVAAGHGVTLLPQMAIDAGLIDNLDISLKTFKNLTPTRTIGLLWRKTNPRAKTFEALGTVIKKAHEK